jgi:biotin carboxylase
MDNGKVRMNEKKERILILGAGVMQKPALLIAREMGLETIAVDADAGAPSVGLADRFEQIDLKDQEGICALGRSLMADGGLGGIMTAGTDFSATVAWAAEKLELPGIPYERALDASDKERMRRRFKEAGIPSPEFVILKNPPGKKGEFSLPFPYPAVVKPVDNMGSRGCRRIDTFEELERAVEEALKFSRSGRVIVEEYMDGPEFSVDALVYRDEITITGLADRHIFFPPYCIEMGHTMPTGVDHKTAESLLTVFRAAVRALGISHGAAKGDIKFTSRGPMIGEVAARLSGGYMSGWTYPYASGVFPTRGAILIALGKKPDRLEPAKNWTSAERAFISIPGKVRAVHGSHKAKAVPGIKDLFLRIGEGSRVIFPENNVTKCGNVISAAPSREEAVKAAEKAAAAVLIRLEAPNEETSAFLAAPLSRPGVPAFPPDAFSPDERLLALLAAMPPGDLPSPEKTRSREALLLPFPEFLSSGLRDYQGRTVEESLAAVRLLTGLALSPPGKPPEPGQLILGRSFWTALIRGGYQGAVYFLDLFHGPR